MYAISFRIPYHFTGDINQTIFINGSTVCSFPFNKGETIEVADKSWTNSYNGLKAEVIDSQKTSRLSSTFKWMITDLSTHIQKKT